MREDFSIKVRIILQIIITKLKLHSNGPLLQKKRKPLQFDIGLNSISAKKAIESIDHHAYHSLKNFRA